MYKHISSLHHCHDILSSGVQGWVRG